ncbi:MAG: DEAD/DEAH box helicase [Planctomycetota bacterium]
MEPAVTSATRDAICERYLSQLPFPPYPVQEDAIFNWFANEQGVLVCAPTGTGKTLIAEAALYEALQLGRTAYYTTPLVALTDQKFRELQAAVVRWGYPAEMVGMATGNRKINPQAPLQVVVAEILLNRLLHREAFDFSEVWAVVMDEFHSFNDLERGIVWEFGLALLPRNVRTLLLSATVGNAGEFAHWLATRHDRRLALVQSDQRKVPLTYQWVGDQLLDEQLELMFGREGEGRLTPALIFCFNREQCWTVAELLKGKKVVDGTQQKQLAQALEGHDWSRGAGPKLKQLLQRGVGVHHAGVLPKYRRIIEQFFQEKLLSVCVCTETLAAGINLPARSVVLPTLLKGPPGKMKLIEPSSAHQMFGRAGRPQFDDRGFVFALAHEDDVKILRWQEKLNQIPEDTKDPGLIRARKEIKKKMPKRREGVQYWNATQFEQLVASGSANLESRGPLTWRLLAYMLEASPDVALIRQLVSRRLLKGKAVEQANRQLQRMLLTLHRAGYVQLSPTPPLAALTNELPDPSAAAAATEEKQESSPTGTETLGGLTLGRARESVLNLGQRVRGSAGSATGGATGGVSKAPTGTGQAAAISPADSYEALRAEPTERLQQLLYLKGVHPLFAMFLMNHLAIADQNERLQAFECLLEISPSLGGEIEVPRHDELPPGPLATERLDPQLLSLGLATSDELNGPGPDEDPREWRARFLDGPPRVLTLAHKLQRLFQYDFPGVDDLRVRPCWVAGELLALGGDFNLYITSHRLQKQEGVIFRHLLRLVLLIDELAMLCPAEMSHDDWKEDLGNLAYAIESSCRAADPGSAEQWLDEARQTLGPEL